MGIEFLLTDKLTSADLIEKAFVYLTSLSRECRKALTMKFEHEYKGIPFSSTEPTIRKEIESWFIKRDKNVKLNYTKSMTGKPGEIIIAYSGATKDAHFKIHVNTLFTLVGSADEAKSYLKSLNLYVDKRDFTK